MSIEVDVQHYCHVPQKKRTPRQSLDQALAEYTKVELPQFFYNYLHDLESLWWITQFMLFLHHDSSLEKLDDHQMNQRLLEIKG